MMIVVVSEAIEQIRQNRSNPNDIPRYLYR